MEVRPVLRLFANVLIACSVCACSTIGPPSVRHDRLDYETAIGESWKQQTLLNIVKVRYGDIPVFLDVAQVVASYQLQSTVGTGFTGTNASANVVGPTVVAGSLLAQGTYTDRPTVMYAPLTGDDFMKRLMTPIPPSSLLFMLQSNYPADRVLAVSVSSINGVSNQSRRGAGRPADAQFIRLALLIRDLQLAEALQVRIEHGKGGSETATIMFPAVADPRLAAIRREVASILHLKAGTSKFEVHYGGYSGSGSEIAMMTRSMVQIMQEIAAAVQVPASDIAAGRTTPGASGESPSQAQDSFMPDIASGNTPPSDAYVAVQYNGHWFWIAGGDIRSKTEFSFLTLLFSISDTGSRARPPIVTVPAF